MALPACALAERLAYIGGGAAAGAALGGPGGAAAGGAAGALVGDAVEGDDLREAVTEAALSAPQVIGGFDWMGLLPWIVGLVLMFTPSGPFLLRKLRERFAKPDRT